MIIEISGIKVGIKFNNAAIEELPKIKHSNKGYYAFLTTLVYCAYIGWCVWKQVDIELEYGDINEWVDSSVNNPEIAEQLTKIYELYQECEAYKKMQKKSDLNGQLLEEEAIK